MINFLTKDDTSFTDQGILCQGEYYSGHLGVTKLCRFGEPTLFETISKRVGATEAKAILKKSSERGNRIHLEMEISGCSPVSKIVPEAQTHPVASKSKQGGI